MPLTPICSFTDYSFVEEQKAVNESVYGGGGSKDDLQGQKDMEKPNA